MVRRLISLLLVLSTLSGAITPVAEGTSSAPDPDVEAATDAIDAEFETDGPTAATGETPHRRAALDESLALTTTLHLTPDRPGEVMVTLRYDVPPSVTAVETKIPANATVTSVDNFAQTEDSTRYEWQTGTNSPSLTYRLPVNETANSALPVAKKGTHLFADAGPWALFRKPKTGTRWKWRGGDVGLTKSTTVDGSGVVGEELVLLGPYEEHRRRANDQQFRLIVPQSATLGEEPSAILDSYADASGRLQVGDRDDQVLVIAAPTSGVEWGVRGLQTGDSDIWVRDRESLSTPNNVWLHEYVHSRQSFRATDESRWFTEGGATYYAALLALQQGHIGYDRFQSWLALGARDPVDATVLSTPSTWNGEGHYRKGALVAGYLDYRIRAVSDGAASLDAVLKNANGHDGAVTGEAFQTFVGTAATESVRDDADRYVTTQAVPSTWTLDEHLDAFGPFDAHFDARFVASESTPARVSGPYREFSTPTPTSVTFVTGETLHLPVAVQNTGGRAASYDVAVGVDGTTEAQLTGRLEPRERRVESVAYTFQKTGTHTLSVGGREVTVSVREPAEPQVVDVSVTPTRIAANERATVSATVRNGESRPGGTTVRFVLDGEVIAEKRVALDAEARTTVSTTVRPSTPGMYRVGAEGAKTVALDVEPADPASTTVGGRETETASGSATSPTSRTTSSPAASQTTDPSPESRTTGSPSTSQTSGPSSESRTANSPAASQTTDSPSTSRTANSPSTSRTTDSSSVTTPGFGVVATLAALVIATGTVAVRSRRRR